MKADGTVELTSMAGSYEVIDFCSFDVWVQNSTYTITSFGPDAFKNQSNLTEVILPTSLCSSLDTALDSCPTSSLRVTITASDTDTTVQSGAFKDNKTITEVVFKDIKTIEGSAFNGCKKLRMVYLPTTIEEIGVYAFANCDTLEALDGKGIYCEGDETWWENLYEKSKGGEWSADPTKYVMAWPTPNYNQSTAPAQQTSSNALPSLNSLFSVL